MTDFLDRLQSTLGDHYIFERELGNGGMSRVFLAEERRLGRRVVVRCFQGRQRLNSLQRREGE